MAQQDDIKTALDVVRKDVADQTTVIAGMSVYVAGIQKQLVDLANASKDTETAGALMALASQIESNTKSDADAMAANLTGVTPAQAGTADPVPVVDPNPAQAATANSATDAFGRQLVYNSTGGLWKDGDGLKYDSNGTLIPAP